MRAKARRIRSELRLFDGPGPRYSTATRLQLVGSLSLDAPLAAICLCHLWGPPNGSGRLSRSNSRSNTADPGPLSQASGSNVPVSLLPRPRVNDNIFPGLSSGSDVEYCTWLRRNKLTSLLGASSYKQFDAGYFQGTFINPTLYSTLGARWVFIAHLKCCTV